MSNPSNRDCPPGTTLPRWWSDLTSAEFAQIDRERAIAVLTLAATEQHGPHLPLSVDSDIAIALIEQSFKHLPAHVQALFLPVQQVGVSIEHTSFEGTLSIGLQTALNLWSDVAQSVASCGIKKLLLLSTHGGNTPLMQALSRDLRARFGLTVLYVPNWDTLLSATKEGQQVLKRFTNHEKRFGSHAGQLETALMLHIKPHSVRMDLARTFHSNIAEISKQFDILGHAAKLAWMAQDLNKAGAAGNARAARAEDGKALLEAGSTALARLLIEIDQFSLDALSEMPSWPF